MSMWTYIVIFIVLFVTELVYFRVAKRFGIVDKPDEESSHSSVVLRGGGIIIPLAMFLWAIQLGLMGEWDVVVAHWPFFIGLLLMGITGFWDDIHSLSAIGRLVVMFVVVGLMLGQLMLENGGVEVDHWFHGAVILALATFVYVGGVNIINFMDGINGITAGYGLAVLVPLLLLNHRMSVPFSPNSFLWVAALGVLVFGLFNFRPKGKAKCFAGDVGSLSIGFILLFAVFRLIRETGDGAWLVLLLLYGIDGGLTIVHRVMLHENILHPHRKHAYQLMANELGMNHVVVSSLYAGLQLVISLIAIYVVPDTLVAHWVYFLGTALVMAVAYVLFMRRYYHLHEEYLREQEGHGG